MSCAVGIFARAPTPGRTKTRLIPMLGAEGAARFHEACLQDTIESVLRLERFSVHLFLTPASASGAVRKRLGTPIPILSQGTGHLGTRMARALEYLLSLEEIDSALLIGSDAPDLPPELLLEAERVLREPRVVLGPAHDGGFTLIGAHAQAVAPGTDAMTDARRRNVGLQRLLQGIPWSSSETLRRTVDRLAAFGIEPVLLPAWWDVDDPEGYRLLIERLRESGPNGAPHVREFVSSL